MPSHQVLLGAGKEVNSEFLLWSTKASRIEIYISISIYVLSIYLYLCGKGKSKGLFLCTPVNRVSPLPFKHQVMRSLKVRRWTSKGNMKDYILGWLRKYSKWGEELTQIMQNKKHFVLLCVMKYRHIMYIYLKTLTVVQKGKANLFI